LLNRQFEEVVTEKPVVTEKEEETSKVISTVESEVEPGGAPTAQVKIFEEAVINTPRSTPRALELPADYSGYRVEFLSSPYKLPGSHEIFYKHGRITMDQHKDGSFSYLLGAFNELKDADDFLKNILIRQYPNAKVVRYKKGNRING